MNEHKRRSPCCDQEAWRFLATSPDEIVAAFLEGLRSPRNSLGKLALPKGRMERAVEDGWEAATSPVGDPNDGIEMHDLAVLADGIVDALRNQP